jgi:hypothetical protein
MPEEIDAVDLRIAFALADASTLVMPGGRS